MEDDRRSRAEALFAVHGGAVLAYARRRASAATADDVLSDVFLVAWRRLDDLPADPRPWLLACARSALANHRRADRRRVRLLGRLSAAGVAASTQIELPDGALARALAVLTERDRETLLLTAWEAFRWRVLPPSSAARRKRSGCVPWRASAWRPP